ncbi:hypothetical protein JYK04_00001 [Streptomyces nojiriensis]|nr:hypothetical protein JYK04_00001 [Streptomyces nojiriensis]
MFVPAADSGFLEQLHDVGDRGLDERGLGGLHVTLALLQSSVDVVGDLVGQRPGRIRTRAPRPRPGRRFRRPGPGFRCRGWRCSGRRLGPDLLHGWLRRERRSRGRIGGSRSEFGLLPGLRRRFRRGLRSRKLGGELLRNGYRCGCYRGRLQARGCGGDGGRALLSTQVLRKPVDLLTARLSAQHARQRVRSGRRGGRLRGRGRGRELHGREGQLRGRSGGWRRGSDTGGAQGGGRAVEHADCVGRAGQEVQDVQTEVGGQAVDILQRPVLTTGLLTGDLRLRETKAVGEDVLAHTCPRHQRSDRQPEKLFRTHHHDATLAQSILIPHRAYANRCLGSARHRSSAVRGTVTAISRFHVST